ncbi:MAG: ATP-binding cassette domain-containing protein [Candidatus Aminicenantes bacterium]|nr:ATP-binding cassette domain-containing protein [Candidatus Aminicenantes bacterium]
MNALIAINMIAQPGVDAARQDLSRVLMQVKGLRKSFGGQVVLDGVDMELREGEVVLLRGENGSGKTTLLNILTGNMEPDAGEIDLFVNSHPEHFHFPRRWWQELNPWDHFTPERVAAEGIGRTWQDVRLFGSQTLLDNLAVAHPDQPGEKPWRMFAPFSKWRKAEAANQHEVSGLLETLNLGDRGDSSADMISLGQTKRIAFTRSARANSKIIFLDETLSGLDRKGIKCVIDVLRELAAAQRLTLVIVEHVFNIPIILDFATAVWTLDDGHLTRETVADARADSSTWNTNDLSALIRQMAGPNAVITEEPLPRGARLTRVALPTTSKEPLLKIKGLMVRRGHRLVVGEEKDGAAIGFNLTIHKGELIFLQAPNGWGKTSLLEALAGILPCRECEGSIELGGMPLERQTVWERRLSGLAVIPARENVFNNLTVDEYQHISAGNGKRVASPVASNNPQSEISNLQSRMMSSLSGGERKRLVLENANYQNAKIKVWDEPFGSLDANTSESMAKFVLPGNETACIVLVPSTHKESEVL